MDGLNIKEKYEPLNPLFPKTFTKVEIDPALLNAARAKRRHTEPASMNDFVTSVQKKNTKTSSTDGPGASTSDKSVFPVFLSQKIGHTQLAYKYLVFGVNNEDKFLFDWPTEFWRNHL